MKTIWVIKKYSICIILFLQLFISLQHLSCANMDDSKYIELFFDNIMIKDMKNTHIPGVVISMVKEGTLLFSKGYGFADKENTIPVDPSKTIFGIGSVTKLFTWTAVMQLVEQGKLDIDTDVNTYLDFRIPDTYPGQPITLKHLMTHTGGFEDSWFEMRAPDVEHITPSGKWLPKHIPYRVRPPGLYAAYSNYGAALAGYIVEQVSGMSIQEYLKNNIFMPLEMNYTSIEQPIPDILRKHVAYSYSFNNKQYNKVDRLFSNIPAVERIYSTADDMAHFMAAHLQNGQYKNIRILKNAKQMHPRLFSHDKRLNGFAYGFYELNKNGVNVIGHVGGFPHFYSLFVLLPEQKLGLFISTNSSGGWYFIHNAFYSFMDTFFPAPESVKQKQKQDLPGNVRRFTGYYRLTRSPYKSIFKLGELFNTISFSIKENTLIYTESSGTLIFTYVESNLFRNTLSDNRLVFHEDKNGIYAFFDTVPYFAYEKMAWFESPPLHLVLLLLFILSSLFTLIIVIVHLVKEKNLVLNVQYKVFIRLTQWALLLIGALILLFIIGVFIQIIHQADLYIGKAGFAKIVLLLPFGIIFFIICSAIGIAVIWKKRVMTTGKSIYYTVVLFINVCFILWLHYWNLLGWNF